MNKNQSKNITKEEQLTRLKEQLAMQKKELDAANDALNEFRNKYEQLILNLENDYFFYANGTDGNVIYVSKSIKKILGYSVSEYKNLRKDLLTDNPINQEALKKIELGLKGEKQGKFHLEVTAKDTSHHMLEILESPVFNASGILVSVEGLARDISDSYYAEELRKEQEEKYHQVFNFASEYIFIYELTDGDTPSRFIDVNQYMRKKLGYSRDEFLKMKPQDLEAAEIWNETHERKLGEKYERIWETKEGSILNMEISERFFDLNKRKVCIAVARDVSERKKALEEIKFMNEELINEKENLEALLDNLTQTQEQLVQSEKMAALGQLIAGVAHEINTPLGAIKASVGNLRDSLDLTMSSLPSILKSQSRQNLDLYIKTYELAGSKHSELSSREKRELKRNLRKELKEKDVTDAEILADILGYLEIYEVDDNLIKLLKLDDAKNILNNVRNSVSLVKNTNTIAIASEKASKVVFALKKYAHRDSLGEKVPTDIIDGIETVLTLYDNQIKQGITLVKDYAELPLTMCYQDEINQIWTNLIQNAIQAMGTTGTLTIKTVAEEKYVEITVSDTGEGIEPTIMDKIFDPFFTTKKQGEGSGLGLDIVKKIIDKHGGDIDVISKLGEGSSFIIKIPQY